jgi:hypothetical protein
MPDRPIADRKTVDRKTVDRKTADHKTRITIGQILSALDDRNMLAAMRLLEPVSESSELSPGPDQPEGPRCVKCATRGE